MNPEAIAPWGPRATRHGVRLSSCPYCSAPSAAHIHARYQTLSCFKPRCSAHEGVPPRVWRSDLAEGRWREPSRHARARGCSGGGAATPGGRIDAAHVLALLADARDAPEWGWGGELAGWGERRGWVPELAEGLRGEADAVWAPHPSALVRGLAPPMLGALAQACWPGGRKAPRPLVLAIRDAEGVAWGLQLRWSGVGELGGAPKGLRLGRDALARVGELAALGSVPEALEVARRGGAVVLVEGDADYLCARAALRARGELRRVAVLGALGRDALPSLARALREAAVCAGVELRRVVLVPHRDSDGGGEARMREAAATLERVALEVAELGVWDVLQGAGDLADLAGRGLSPSRLVAELDGAPVVWRRHTLETARAALREELEKALDREGVTLVCAPTGSGKSYAAAAALAERVGAALATGERLRALVTAPTRALRDELRGVVQRALVARLGAEAGRAVPVRRLLSRADEGACDLPAEAGSAARLVPGGSIEVCRRCACTETGILPVGAARCDYRRQWVSRRLERARVVVEVATFDAALAEEARAADAAAREALKAEARAIVGVEVVEGAAEEAAARWDVWVCDETPRPARVEHTITAAAVAAAVKAGDLEPAGGGVLLAALGLEAEEEEAASWTGRRHAGWGAEALRAAVPGLELGPRAGAGAGGAAWVRVAGVWADPSADRDAWRDVLLAEGEAGADHRAWRAAVKAAAAGWRGCYVRGGELVVGEWRPVPSARCAVVLDATATPALVRGALGVERVEVVDLAAALPAAATVERVAWGWSRSAAGSGAGAQRLAALVASYDAPDTLWVVAGALEAARLRSGAATGEPVRGPVTYFGAADAVGSNAYAGCRTVVVGAHHVPVAARVALAEALQGRGVEEAEALQAAGQELETRAALQALGRVRPLSATTSAPVRLVVCDARILQGREDRVIEPAALVVAALERAPARAGVAGAAMALRRVVEEAGGIWTPTAAGVEVSPLWSDVERLGARYRWSAVVEAAPGLERAEATVCGARDRARPVRVVVMWSGGAAPTAARVAEVVYLARPDLVAEGAEVVWRGDRVELPCAARVEEACGAAEVADLVGVAWMGEGAAEVAWREVVEVVEAGRAAPGGAAPPVSWGVARVGLVWALEALEAEGAAGLELARGWPWVWARRWPPLVRAWASQGVAGP